MNQKIFLVIAVCCLLASCRSPSYLPYPNEFKHHVRGLHFKGFLNDGEKIEGEIIAIEGERLFLHPNMHPEVKMQSISKDILKRGEVVLATTSNKPKQISTAAGFMSIIPLSHGFLGILTIPTTLIMTIGISNNAAYGTYSIKYPNDINWTDLRKFARFPQGIPAKIELVDIK